MIPEGAAGQAWQRQPIGNVTPAVFDWRGAWADARDPFLGHIETPDHAAVGYYALLRGESDAEGMWWLEGGPHPSRAQADAQLDAAIEVLLGVAA